jgi:hypothetical protein
LNTPTSLARTLAHASRHFLSALVLGAVCGASQEGEPPSPSNTIWVAFSIKEGAAVRDDVLATPWEEEAPESELLSDVRDLVEGDEAERRLPLFERYVAALIAAELNERAPFHVYLHDAAGSKELPLLQVQLRLLNDKEEKEPNKYTGKYVLELSLAMKGARAPVTWSFLASAARSELTPRKLLPAIPGAFRSCLETSHDNPDYDRFFELLSDVPLGLPQDAPPAFFHLKDDAVGTVALPARFCHWDAEQEGTEFELRLKKRGRITPVRVQSYYAYEEIIAKAEGVRPHWGEFPEDEGILGESEELSKLTGEAHTKVTEGDPAMQDEEILPIDMKALGYQLESVHLVKYVPSSLDQCGWDYLAENTP